MTFKKSGFTLAEVLITLAVIGIVAMLTIPNLVQNYKKRVVETKLSRFYFIINQAIRLSEAENGPAYRWERMAQFRTTGDIHSEGILPEEWFNKYLVNYIKPVRIDTKGTYEFSVDLYFADGSMVTFSGSSWIFYPNAKDYKILEKDNEDGTSYLDRDREYSGSKYFTFGCFPYSNNKYLSKKCVEPYINSSWDGTIETLKEHPSLGCHKNATNEPAYCTKLIQLNGWKIPEDYPFKF